MSIVVCLILTVMEAQQQVPLNVILQNKKTNLSIMHKYIRSTRLEAVAGASVFVLEAILQH